MKKREVIEMLQSYGAVFVRDGDSHHIYRIGREIFIVSFGTKEYNRLLVTKIEKKARLAQQALQQEQRRAL